MSVDRDLRIRILTPYKDCVSFLSEFTNNFWGLNDKDGSIVTLSENDLDDFDFIKFHDKEKVLEIFIKRENKGWKNYVDLWSTDFEESYLVEINKIENTYSDSISQYELSISIGIGKRIKNAERYTDYGYYLNQIIPKLQNIGCSICEFQCTDYDF